MLFEKLVEPLSRTIDGLGSSEFYPRFFTMMRSCAQIDQYMVFEFSPSGDHVSCRLAHNPNEPNLGVELASRYVAGGYLKDELLKRLRAEMDGQPGQSSAVLLLKRTLPATYRKEFFNVPDFASKFAFVVVDPETKHLFYINFYSREVSEFDPEDSAELRQITPLVGSLLLKHFREERRRRGVRQSLLISGLSEREAQICELILKGHTAKSIAQRLELSESTVITYKKRAFEKLNIKMKSELVNFV